MLTAAARLRTSSDFRRVTRSGVRAGRPTVVVHAAPSTVAAVRVGLVVSKSVGNAVTRNRVKRRLRHLAAGQLSTTDQLSTTNPVDVVIRALPAAATHPRRLADDLAGGWRQALAKLARRTVSG